MSPWAAPQQTEKRILESILLRSSDPGGPPLLRNVILLKTIEGNLASSVD